MRANGTVAMDLSALIDFGALAERVRASVVAVHCAGVGAGAGTIWRADGLIATNHHVAPLAGADVVLADGRRFEARVVARDVENDLALLKIAAIELPGPGGRRCPRDAGRRAGAGGRQSIWLAGRGDDGCAECGAD